MSSNKVEIVFTAKDLTLMGVSSLRKGLNSVYNTVFSLKGAIAGLGLGLAGREFLNASNTTEQLNTRLQVLLGSVSEGNRLFNSMADYASKVPFEYEEIMNSATMLSGILKGGVDEINQWMPLIGDLAAASGLSIQETTEQVQRMLSAGAASADKFRERGVLSMLGFTAGVSYSVEETRNMMINSWNKAGSQFKGATEKLAATWDGTMSMIGDKWFAFRNLVMDAGPFDFMKAFARTIDSYLGKALQNIKQDGLDFSTTIVTTFDAVSRAVGWVADGLWSLDYIWTSLRASVNEFKVFTLEVLDSINSKFLYMLGFIPVLGEGLKQMARLFKADIATSLNTATLEAALLNAELAQMAIDGMPSEGIKNFSAEVIAEFEKIRQAKRDALGGGESAPGGKGNDLVTTTLGDNESLRAELEKRYAAIQDQIALESELRTMKYEQDLVALQDYSLVAGQTEQEYLENKKRLTEQYEEEITEIRKREEEKRQQNNIIFQLAEYATYLNGAQRMMYAAQGQSRKAFQVAKALAIARAAVALPTAVLESFKNGGGYPWGLIPAGIMLATGLLEINKIRRTQYQAHGGITRVPASSGPFNATLNPGERVLTSDQNKDFTDFINRGGGGGGVQIGTLNIDMHFDSVEGLRNMSRSEIAELVADKFLPAFDLLARNGVAQQRFQVMEAR